MDTIEVRHILDAGAECLHSTHPDSLVRSALLASLLVTSGASRSTLAATNAFRLWKEPLAKAHAPSKILAIANERTTS